MAAGRFRADRDRDHVGAGSGALPEVPCGPGRLRKRAGWHIPAHADVDDSPFTPDGGDTSGTSSDLTPLRWLEKPAHTRAAVGTLRTKCIVRRNDCP